MARLAEIEGAETGGRGVAVAAFEPGRNRALGAELGRQRCGYPTRRAGGLDKASRKEYPEAPPVKEGTTKSRILLLAQILVFTGLYLCCGLFGLSLAFVNPSASAIWPP